MSSKAPSRQRIAVDAMGADRAPEPEVEGALAALAATEALEVLLVGDLPRVSAALAGRTHPRLTLRPARQVILMDDAPSVAVKSKKDSSMRVCFDLAHQGEADAVVSAGNSGAMMACGLFVLKRLRGVERPGIMTLAPTRAGGYCVALDVGANTELKPAALAQLGILGAAYARVVLGVARPRVAVLSNGEESSKGTPLTREAHRLLRAYVDGANAAELDFDFRGYAEGRDFFTGEFDVIVTDGYTGNACLKTFEGAMRLFADLVKAEAVRSARGKLGGLLMRPVFDALKRKVEPDELGGAPLLGVGGVVIVCHGNATASAMKNGILTAARYVELGLADKLAGAVARHHALVEAPPG